MAIPPVAQMTDNEPAEGEGGKVAISCAAQNCTHNMGGKCGAGQIKVSSSGQCETMDTGSPKEPGAPSGNLPRPPLPPMSMLMGNGANQ